MTLLLSFINEPFSNSVLTTLTQQDCRDRQVHLKDPPAVPFTVQPCTQGERAATFGMVTGV
ncbi:hypothetical protein Gxy13693_020_008 [Komagataeibacter xylinus NBRC 13693]|uniref:Uncharacterized protein n=1 Tax=Komagataeibacter xylinus NBRC 13693 TaxID=1234668 RepID=A0A0D6Q8M2_KOMXY|nr:hypothetical protein Gxy13693_020_008 [Komagataeibacter xylinus NBRC 13693]